MLRGRRDRYHRIGFLIAFGVGAAAIPVQMGVGDSLARWVYNNQPVKFAAIELVPETSSDVPETLLGHLDADGDVSGGIPIPGLASWLSDPATGRSTVVQGLDTVPADDRPTTSEVNAVHLSWDIMVGFATLLFLLALWYWVCWIFRRDMPRSRLFLWLASGAGIAAILAMEAGWVVSEVGRQPWIVYDLMRVEDAATANTGVWVTFILVAALYLGLAATTILILHKMAVRAREREVTEHEVPYGPSSPARAGRREAGEEADEEVTV
jgi:cytochrome d ubiquinol oxidase subunit I